MLDLFTFQAVRLSAHLCFRERVGNCQEHTVLAWILVLLQPLNPQHNAGILLNQGLIMKLQTVFIVHFVYKSSVYTYFCPLRNQPKFKMCFALACALSHSVFILFICIISHWPSKSSQMLPCEWRCFSKSRPIQIFSLGGLLPCKKSSICAVLRDFAENGKNWVKAGSKYCWIDGPFAQIIPNCQQHRGQHHLVKMKPD